MNKKKYTKHKADVIINKLKKNITTLKMINNYYLDLMSRFPNGGTLASLTTNHRNATDDVIDDLTQILFNIMDDEEYEFLMHEYDSVSTDIAQI